MHFLPLLLLILLVSLLTSNAFNAPNLTHMPLKLVVTSQKWRGNVGSEWIQDTELHVLSLLGRIELLLRYTLLKKREGKQQYGCLSFRFYLYSISILRIVCLRSPKSESCDFFLKHSSSSNHKRL